MEYSGFQVTEAFFWAFEIFDSAMNFGGRKIWQVFIYLFYFICFFFFGGGGGKGGGSI